MSTTAPVPTPTPTPQPALAHPSTVPSSLLSHIPPASDMEKPSTLAQPAQTPGPTTQGQPLQPLPASINNVGTKRPASAVSVMPQTQAHFAVVPATTNQMLSASAQFRYNNGGVIPLIEAPQIYSAIYSGVDVYEMEVNNVAVMRRRNDSWLNATQILKVAKIDKGKRTKILEKEIQTGEHEKVQGGYGKYQGTWVKFERGMEICRQYGVEDILRPLLTHDMGQDGGVAGQDSSTPTKEQAMAAQRKRMYNATATADRQNGVSGTFFRNISTTASHAVAAINKARIDSPNQRSRARARTPGSRAASFSRQPSNMSATEDGFPQGSQQSFASDFSAAHSMDLVPTSQQSIADLTGPPRKKPKGNLAPADSFTYGGSEPSANQPFPASPTEPNESFLYKDPAASGSGAKQHNGVGPLPPLPYEMSQEAEDRKSQLLGLFLDPNIMDQQIQDAIVGMTPKELDMPIDNHCHTVLHWAAALSRMSLLRALIRAGASPFRVNSVGQTALMRACTVTNSMELNTFPELLDVLGCTLEVCDHKGRTVLHQIAVTSAVKGRNAASRYYLESLLEWVVRQGSGSQSQSSQEGNQAGQPKMGLARFMSEIVNAQDASGDTALNIAAKNGNKSVISQLLEVGANPNIANRSGLRPVDFGIGSEGGDTAASTAIVSTPVVASGSLEKSPAKTSQSNDEILSSIALVLNEATASFHKEIKEKQTSVDSLHNEIRTASANLTTARRQLEAIQDKVRKQTHSRQQIANLTHAREDEQFRSVRDTSTVDAIASWQTQISAIIESTSPDATASAALLPSSTVLRTRMKALTERKEVMRKMVAALKGRSKETEVKYRKVVSLCTGVPVEEVDAVVEGLLRAVESEKAELELGRVRRFLGGVDGIGIIR